MSTQPMDIKRVIVDPQYLRANSDGGYQITAAVVEASGGRELHISAERVVISDASHVSPRYDRYMVAPRVVEDAHIPTLAQMVADACGWDYIDPLVLAECIPGSSEKNALKWLQTHSDLVLKKFGIK